jgi:cyclophilin family peptidyl-prolyl cis-trans isomerase
MSKSLMMLPFLALATIAAKPAPVAPKPVVSVAAPAAIAADPANRWTIELSNGGRVVVQLRPDLAPAHVYRIQQLTAQGFYNGLAFHRVIPGFMAQGGDPQGTGQGGSPLPDLKAEFNDLPHLRGVASMARSQEPDTANSQFFIVLSPTMNLDKKYTGFGRVIEGMPFVDQIAVGEPPASPTRIVRATLGGPLPAPSPEAIAGVVTPSPAPAPATTPVPAAAPAEAATEIIPAPTQAPASAVTPAPAPTEAPVQPPQ